MPTTNSTTTATADPEASFYALGPGKQGDSLPILHFSFFRKMKQAKATFKHELWSSAIK